MNALAHKVTWQAPRPLWRGTTPFQARPQILRFASDDFMEQLLATLAEEPARISDRIARYETWRDPPLAVDLEDPIVRVPLPAPMKEAKRRRFWRSAPSAPPPAPTVNKQLKLYQPAHQRYYLVAGTLACQVPGLPERAVEGGHETVGFVIRRLLSATGSTASDPAQLVEYAYVREGDDARWQRVASGTDLAPGEEQLPLFPLQHRDEEGKPRTIWAGMIPTARREDYLGKAVVTTPVSLADGQKASLNPPAPAAKPNTTVARTAQVRIEVVEPWKALVRAAMKAGSEFSTKASSPGETASERLDRVRNYNNQFQHQSWLLLLDLRKWIDANLPGVRAKLANPSATGLTTQEQAVWDFLEKANANALIPAMSGKTMAVSMRVALQEVAAFENGLEAATKHYGSATQGDAGWPDFHFPLAGLKIAPFPAGPLSVAEPDGPYKAVMAPTPLPDDTPDPISADTPVILSPLDTTNRDAEELDRFLALLARALPLSNEANAQPIPHAMKLRDVMIKTAGDQGLFVIRMVHMNADCGPLHPPTLSSASERFRLASFFDPDAPVRPITITLPADTSPAGLRKHGRGAAFVMSDLLCGQVQRAKGLGFIDLVLQVLPWPFHKDIDAGGGGNTGGCKGGQNVEIGMICSLSIPIITLCAMILLICIVMLLDFIFRWVPWFIACFPLPRFKGKPA